MTDDRPALPSALHIPVDQDGPVFREPWEARALAMAVALHEAGVFAWKDWAAALSEEIQKGQRAGDADTGEDYYRYWLAALEGMVSKKGLADSSVQALYRQAWDRAADRTPHGTPIELRQGDFEN
jgi:nitrile hydratase accessory protein